jgi:hypothetical protein
LITRQYESSKFAPDALVRTLARVAAVWGTEVDELGISARHQFGEGTSHGRNHVPNDLVGLTSFDDIITALGVQANLPRANGSSTPPQFHHLLLRKTESGLLEVSVSVTDDLSDRLGTTAVDLRKEMETVDAIVAGLGFSPAAGETLSLSLGKGRKSVRRRRLRTAERITLLLAAVVTIAVGVLTLLGLPPITWLDPDTKGRPSTPSVSTATTNVPSARGTQPNTGKGYPLPGDDSRFIGDATYEDGSHVIAGKVFTKIWAIQNVGRVLWEGRYLARIGRADDPTQLRSATREPIPTTPAGAIVQVSARLTAPDSPGPYRADFKMVDQQGQVTFPNHDPLYVEVVVDARK